MIKIYWLLRKTTHGHSDVAHAFYESDQIGRAEFYSATLCNPRTKYRRFKLADAGDDWPKKCPLCLNEISDQVVSRLSGKKDYDEYKEWSTS